MESDGISARLIKHVFELKYEDLPTNVVAQAKNCILDYLGTALAGSSTEVGRLVKQQSRSFAPSRDATVMATGKRATAQDAALVNGIVGHVLELDDGNRFAMGHPGVATIPSALALAEKQEASGVDLILAAVCGYEIFGRLGRAMNPSHFNRGFHTTGTLGTMAATVAASKILRLTEGQMLNAFGIAGSLAAGISEFLEDGSMTKQIHAGRAAQNGILASELAAKGFTGPTTVLEGGHGFFKALSDNVVVEKVTDNLGQDYQISNVYFKRHASCRHSHAAVDAALEIVSKEPMDPKTIDEVLVKTYSAAYDYTNNKRVSTPLSAKMSMPYCIAVTILHRNAGPEQFTEEAIQDKAVRHLMDKVKMTIDQELDRLVPNKRGAIVEITAGGQRYSSRIDLPKGEPENPLSNTEFEDKFRNLSSSMLKPKGIKNVLKTVARLDRISDVNVLTRLLVRHRK